MTVSKLRPKIISIGVSLITLEIDTILQDDRIVIVPVDDDIVFITVNHEIVFLPDGSVSYDVIADLLEAKGYLKKHWQISNIWQCIPKHIANEIF